MIVPATQPSPAIYLTAIQGGVSGTPEPTWPTGFIPGQDITREDIYDATAITYPAAYRTTMTGARLKEVLEDVAETAVCHAVPKGTGLADPDPPCMQ